MKNAKFAVEFITHCLAIGAKDGKDYDSFARDSSGSLIFQQSWFYSTFEKAIKMARMRNIRPGDIQVDLRVSAPVEVYNRRYAPNKSRKHEAIMPGAKVEFNAIVDDNVTESVLRELLRYVGSFVGMSPYGYNLGFGKFSVISVEVQSSEI